jgi:diketogulonate reductase-like aldo/keto reductase
MQFVEANGAKIPAIGLGTWELRGRTCARLVEQAIRLGYRHIDTAQVYENEREVGEGLRASKVKRDDVFVPKSTSCCCTGRIRTCRCRKPWARWRMSRNSA